MNVLIIGCAKPWALERTYLKFMSPLCQVDFFDAHGKFLDFYASSTYNKVTFRLGFSTFLRKLNEEVLQKVEQNKYSLIWVWKGMEIFPETLKAFKRRGTVLANYNPDNPFVFSGKGSGNQNITDSISLYDLHFTYDYSVKTRIEAEYAIPCEILPFGFDLDEELYQKISAEPEVLKACFLGNPDQLRGNFIKTLIGNGVELDLYGHGWRKFIGASEATVHDAVYGDDLWRVLRKYRVQLNLMRLHNASSHNMRSFEVPAIGGVLLAPDTPDHKRYFHEPTELFLYSDADHCTKQIQTLLGSSKKKIDRVRESARKRSMLEGYSYKSRAEHVIQILETLSRN